MRGRTVIVFLLVAVLSATSGCEAASSDCWPELKERHVIFYSAIDPDFPRPAEIKNTRMQLRTALRQCAPDAKFAEDPSIEGAGVRGFDSYITLLDLAILADDVSLTEAYLRRTQEDPTAQIDAAMLDYGGLYLGLAAFSESSNVAKWLLEHDFDANEPEDSELTPLHGSQVRTEDGLKVIRDLVSFGADIERRAGGAVTPLMLARLKGDLRKVQCLLALGATVPAEHEYVGLYDNYARPEYIQVVDDYLKSEDRVMPESILGICSL